jgi:GMP synthase (glutamine-hydrolysing)
MNAAAPGSDEKVIVVDFGAQYAQLIARRVREAHVYSEIVAPTITAAEIAEKAPTGIIFSGGPDSVHAEGAIAIDPAVYDLGVPILGICYGAQLIAQQNGGLVDRTDRGEYGRTMLTLDGDGGILLGGTPTTQPVWMSHFDAIVQPPVGVKATASTPDAPVAAFEDREQKLYGVQFHPEVMHTAHGQHVIERFLREGCGASGTWTMASIIDTSVEQIREQVGDRRVMCALSGGVDSAVAAAMVHRAVGDQLTCVFVDTGLMRLNEGEQVVETFERNYGIELIHVEAAERFFAALAGITEPEAKRKAIGELFIRVFEDAKSQVEGAEFLVQGTLYPDVIESGSEHASTIKSHHNVGGLPDDIDFQLVEPLRSLFKDEVRQVGRELGLPDEIVERQPFPGPGLGVRIIGEVTPDKVATLQHADSIVREELKIAGLEREIWQSFAVLPDIRSVGVMGDERTYGYPIIIRAVTSEDAMTADWARIPYDVLETMSSRVINEVPGVNRVAYDITSKPPGTIEWE